MDIAGFTKATFNHGTELIYALDLQVIIATVPKGTHQSVCAYMHHSPFLPARTPRTPRSLNALHGFFHNWIYPLKYSSFSNKWKIY